MVTAQTKGILEGYHISMVYDLCNKVSVKATMMVGRYLLRKMFENQREYNNFVQMPDYNKI